MRGRHRDQSGTALWRLVRGYEILPARSEAMIPLAMTGLMARRLIGEHTIFWRNPAKLHQLQIPG
jgi:hypothetical protein